jgi:hypothetical protein
MDLLSIRIVTLRSPFKIIHGMQHPLHPGTTWRYLCFFFDCALAFREHIKHYMNKALTTVRAMLALGNSLCGLQPKRKQMLYCACVLPIATYGSRLWLTKGPLDSLHKMQRHACLWITGAFKTSPIRAAETLAGMPPTHFHVKKLVEQSHIHTCALQASHAFADLLTETISSLSRPLKVKSGGT